MYPGMFLDYLEKRDHFPEVELLVVSNADNNLKHSPTHNTSPQGAANGYLKNPSSTTNKLITKP